LLFSNTVCSLFFHFKVKKSSRNEREKKKTQTKEPKKPPSGKQGVRVFFFGGEFSPPGDTKKKGWRIQQRDFLRIKKTFCHISRKKKLEVARFRQCVPLGRQN